MLWIRAGGGCMRVGETVWNTIKEGGTEKRGGEEKIFKKKGQAGSRDGCLKKGREESGTPLQTMMFASTL